MSKLVIPGVIAQSGNDGGGGGGTVDQTYDPTSTNAQSGTAVAEAVAPALKNKATGAGSIQISATSNTSISQMYVTAIGNVTATGPSGIGISSGNTSCTVSTAAVAIGNALAVGSGSLAISPNSFAGATASDAIQLGGGSNSTAKTFQVYQWPLLDGNTGKIYSDRLPVGGSGADTSLSNITDAGKIVIAHNASIGELYDTLTPVSQTYTAPADGYFYIMGVSTNVDGAVSFYTQNNNESFQSSPRVFRYATTNNVSVVAGYYPCKKGDKVNVLIENIQFSYSGYSNLGMKFFYAVGSESEQQGA